MRKCVRQTESRGLSFDLVRRAAFSKMGHTRTESHNDDEVVSSSVYVYFERNTVEYVRYILLMYINICYAGNVRRI